jgi:hypothetical protein
MIPDGELSAMRAELERTLPNVCNVLTVSYAVTGGVSIPVLGTALANVACRLDHKTGFEALAGGAIQPYSKWILSVPHDTALTTANRVEIGTTTYSVKSVDPAKSWNLILRAEVDPL